MGVEGIFTHKHKIKSNQSSTLITLQAMLHGTDGTRQQRTGSQALQFLKSDFVCQ